MSIYDTLNPEQLKAVQHVEGPLLILAGAGSGKTRVLTHRIAYLIDEIGVNPWNILALTFTNKAANEMRERVDHIIGYGSENIWVSTFHSTCVRILRRYIDRIGYDTNFTIYDTDDQKTLMREVCKYLDIDTKQIKERSLMAAISNAKDELITPEEYERNAGVDFMLKKYAAVYKEYQKRLKQNNALDFDDLIFKTVELFQTTPEVLDYYQKRFKYIMVDEYQDTNTSQFQLISLLANTINDEGETCHNLCVVGDDDQSIYKFRGANIYNILNFEKQYPETTVIKLEQNYRSTQNILNAANEVIANNMERKDKKLWTANEEGDAICFTQFDDAYAEANAIAEDILSAVEHENINYSEFAILYRTNAQSRILEEKLVSNNVPYKLIGGVNFYQRKEIKDLLAYLRIINNRLDDVSAKRIINVPKRGIGLTTIDRISNYAVGNGMSFYDSCKQAEHIPGMSRAVSKVSSFVSFIEIVKSKINEEEYSLTDLMDEILDGTGYLDELKAEKTIEAQTRIENIEELKNKIITYEKNSTEPPTLSGFLEEVSLVAEVDKLEDSTNVVTLMTLHSAKGLEFPYVYMCGMEDGIFPSYMTITSDDPSDIEEERRLCYVGITRAMKKLSLTSARQRMVNGESRFGKPSRFVKEIPRYLLTETASSLTPRFQQEQFSIRENRTASFANVSKQPKPYSFTSASGSSNPFADNPLIQKGFSNFSNQTMTSTTFDKTPKKKAPSFLDTPPDYQIGDLVEHSKFGTGTVLELKKGTRDYEVCVEFPNAGKKKMLAGFAKLKKL